VTEASGQARVYSLDDARQRRRCAATTVDGRQCRNYAVDNGYCRVHADRDVAAPRPERERTELADALRALLGPGFDVDELLRFAGRRLSGDYSVDVFGFDPEITEKVLLPLLRPLYRSWWRVRSIGHDRLPDGGCLVVANHAGTVPADALMVKVGLYDETGRHMRLLGADLVWRLPVVNEVARKMGTTLACEEDATRLLEAGEIVGVWPEGYKGVGKLYRDRYKLQRFGRGGFVEVALRTGSAIVPTAIVGSEEIYPLLYDLRLLARMLGLPYFPIVPQMFAL
jgi:1-acyl-sn-glycerol-3-phosphate acyltransferase